MDPWRAGGNPWEGLGGGVTSERMVATLGDDGEGGDTWSGWCRHLEMMERRVVIERKMVEEKKRKF